MPEKKTIERAKQKKREGKAPTTQAGEFVREEMEHVRRGKHDVKSKEQAVAIGLSKARRAGVDLPPPKGGAKRRSKKGATKSDTGKKSPTRKGATKRTATKRGPTKRGPAKRTAAKRSTTKRSTTKRSTAKRSTAKGGSASRSARQRRGASGRKTGRRGKP